MSHPGPPLYLMEIVLTTTLVHQYKNWSTDSLLYDFVLQDGENLFYFVCLGWNYDDLVTYCASISIPWLDRVYLRLSFIFDLCTGYNRTFLETASSSSLDMLKNKREYLKELKILFATDQRGTRALGRPS